MKTISTFFLVVISLTQQSAKAQVWMGFYGMRTNSSGTLSNSDLGGGFGLSFLSDGRDISALNKPKNIGLNDNLAKNIDEHKNSLQLQVGGNFFYSGLGHRNFYQVPLTSAAGVAKVNLSNGIFGINIMGRFSYKNPSIFTPYFDVFTGYRGMYSNLTVTPYVQAPNTAADTRQTITSLGGLNYGIGGGIMTSLTKRVRLDAGVSYSEAFQNGHLTDLTTAYSDAGGINLNLKNAPNGFMMLNVGILIYLYDDGSSDDDCPCKHNSSGTTKSTSRSSGWGGFHGGGGHSGGSSIGVHIGGGGFGGVKVR